MSTVTIPASGFDGVGASGFSINQTVDAKAVFLGEDAGFRSAVGLYVFDAKGAITDVKMLFTNASLKGSGGELVVGSTSGGVTLPAGSQFGFFIASNADARTPGKQLENAVKFQLVNLKGEPATLADGGNVKLVAIDEKGKVTDVRTEYGTTLFFSNLKQNADGVAHVKIAVDAKTGNISVGFEDLIRGGDRDFNDVKFSINIGAVNTNPPAPPEPEPVKPQPPAPEPVKPEPVVIQPPAPEPVKPEPPGPPAPPAPEPVKPEPVAPPAPPAPEPVAPPAPPAPEPVAPPAPPAPEPVVPPAPPAPEPVPPPAPPAPEPVAPPAPPAPEPVAPLRLRP